MKSLSLARVLPVLENFDSPRLEAPRFEAPRPDLHVVEFDPPPYEPGPVIEDPEANQRHWQEGYEAGVAIGRAQAQAEAVDHDLLLQDAIAAARAEWLAEEASRIETGVEKALGYIEGEICAVAARVLTKLASDRMLERAMSDFAGHVKSLLRDGQAGVVTVHAPEDMIGRLQEKLGALGCLEFVTHDSAEVWVRSGATMIETRLEGWRSDHFGGE
jgi:hypothetical protein